jgi:hypothetical protein
MEKTQFEGFGTRIAFVGRPMRPFRVHPCRPPLARQEDVGQAALAQLREAPQAFDRCSCLWAAVATTLCVSPLPPSTPSTPMCFVMPKYHC